VRVHIPAFWYILFPGHCYQVRTLRASFRDFDVGETQATTVISARWRTHTADIAPILKMMTAIFMSGIFLFTGATDPLSSDLSFPKELISDSPGC
jgi:hypothetical protein